MNNIFFDEGKGDSLLLFTWEVASLYDPEGELFI